MCHSKICALRRFLFSIVFLGNRMIEVAMQQNEVHWEGKKLFKGKKIVRVTNLSIQPILYILFPFAVGGLLLKLKFLVGWSKNMIIMVAWPLGGSNGQVFSLSQDLLARKDLSFKRRLVISGRRHDFVLKPQRSTLLISYQICKIFPNFIAICLKHFRHYWICWLIMAKWQREELAPQPGWAGESILVLQHTEDSAIVITR